LNVEEIIKTVAAKAEVSEAVAQKVVEVVLDVLKEKLPEPIAAQVDGIVSGEADAGEIAKGIGDLLGG
jgi:uncharacterized protein (DUF2267 family)